MLTKIMFQRSMLAQLAARIRAQRAAVRGADQEGDEDGEGAGGPTRIQIDDDCIVQ